MGRLLKMVAISGLLLGCFVTNAPAVTARGYQEVDTSDVRRMMQNEDVLVVFPLSPIEFNNLHISGSVNIPMARLARELPRDKSRKIIFYCLGVKCVASWRAAEKAIELGYRNVFAYREGLPAWVRAGYPTEIVEKLPVVAVEKISTGELVGMLATEDMILVDVNFEDDAHAFYIDHPKRVHIPIDNLDSSLDLLPKNKTLVLVCLKGKRAPTACRFLKGQGYQRVFVLEGGVQKWILEGRPVKQVSS